MSPETAAILAQLPDDAEITVTVRLGDWLRAKEASTGGPEYAPPSEVSARVGFSARYWAEQAKRGKIIGAVQEAGGRWRLPVAACRDHIRGLRRRPAPARGPTLVRSIPRGPTRKAQP